MTPEFLRTVRLWAAGIRALPNKEYHEYRTMYVVDCYNWCIKPNALRSDVEHKVCQCMAKWCKKVLANRLGWAELEDGRLKY